jgi:DNA polymerase, archaea type
LGYTQGKFHGLSGKTINIDTPKEITLQYVERDVELTLYLMQREKFEILNLTQALATITKQTFERVCHTQVSTWWAQIIARTTGSSGGGGAKPSNIKKQKYAGAYIIPPKSSSYANNKTPIYVLDVNSMYPTQMINWNISFETVNCACCENDSAARVSSQIMNIVNEGLSKKKPSLPPRKQAHWICRKVKGGSSIMSTLLREFRAQKLAYKKIGNKMAEKAVKILINSAYGIFGTESFKYRNYAVAELTTAFARQTMHELKDLTSKIPELDAVYGDTDSIFIIGTESKVKVFESEWAGSHPDITIERKGTCYSKMLLGPKKHYILIPVDYPSSPAIVKGFEAKKSDRFEYTRQTFADFVDDYANGIDPTIRLNKRRLQLERGQVHAELLSITIILQKNPEGYSKGTVQYIFGTKLGLCKGEPLTYWLGVDGVYESDPEHYSCAECLDKFDSTFEDLVDALPDKSYRKHVVEAVQDQ